MLGGLALLSGVEMGESGPAAWSLIEVLSRKPVLPLN